MHPYFKLVNDDEAAGKPAVSFFYNTRYHGGNYDALRSAAEGEPPGVQDVLHRLYAKASAERDKITARDQADAKRDAADRRLREPLNENDPEYREARRMREESNQLAAYRRSTEGRLEAIEKVLGEIRDAAKR